MKELAQDRYGYFFRRTPDGVTPLSTPDEPPVGPLSVLDRDGVALTSNSLALRMARFLDARRV